ncbi:MAG: DUF2288 family protein [Myxococcales bacterium]|nr:DUF2288 family protein [Myxococcales bacterium]MCB9523680.1 DUF2288 family protein [Myxococcales bacterium]
MSSTDDLRARLAADVGPVPLRDLAIHHVTGALFVVHRRLALADAAVALVRDDAAAVGAWLQEGTLRKSADADLASWPQTAEYRVVVIHPYVLVQAPPDA